MMLGVSSVDSHLSPACYYTHSERRSSQGEASQGYLHTQRGGAKLTPTPLHQRAVCRLVPRHSLELRRIMAFRHTYSSLCRLSSLKRDVADSSMSKISMMPSTQFPSSLGEAERERARERERHRDMMIS